MKGLQRLRSALGRRGGTVSATTLLALLAAEAGSVAAPGPGVAGPASEAAVRVAAILLKRWPSGSLRGVAVAVALTAGVALGVGITVNHTSPSQPSSNPTQPAPSHRGGAATGRCCIRVV